MPISRRIAKALRKGKSVEIDGLTFHPPDYAKLETGDTVVCYLFGLLVVKRIVKIKQQNKLRRYKVGLMKEDLKSWVGKTKILGVAESPCEEFEIELE
jgi:hypothetical protein